MDRGNQLQTNKKRERGLEQCFAVRRIGETGKEHMSERERKSNYPGGQLSRCFVINSHSQPKFHFKNFGSK